MIRSTSRIIFLLLTILVCGTASQIFAADGDLDRSFDGDGLVTTDNGYKYESVTDLTVQPDGKTVAVGSTSAGPGETVRGVVVRYNVNGSLDSAFGAGGKLVIEKIIPYKVVLQPDGKIVVVGTVPRFIPGAEGYFGDFYVARLNSDGSFDRTFNQTGEVVIKFRSGDIAYSAKIQPDGKIVVAGLVATDRETSDFTLVRFNQDGSFDTTFDGDGVVRTDVELFSRYQTIDDFSIRPDGKIVLTGSARRDGPREDQFLFIRYNANGSLDTTFDGDGIVFTQIKKQNLSYKTSVLSAEGRIYVNGTVNNVASLYRFNADGSPDTTFGTGGAVRNPFRDAVTNIAIQADNKIILALPNGTARLNTDGSPDTTFSGDGIADIPLPPDTFIDITRLFIQPDGKILIGGAIGTGSSSSSARIRDFLIARFEASGSTARSGSAPDFDGDRKADVSLYRPSDRIWYVQNSGNSTVSYTQFGLANDKIAPADYDGDGKTDIAVYRPETGVWFVLRSTSGVYIVRYGAAEDIPQPADYNGDGKAEIAVYRPSIGVWFILNSETNQSRIIQFGTAEDKPVASDYNGDGKTELAVYRPSLGIWFISTSETDYNQYNAVKFGLSTDKLVHSDYDGDGKTDIAVWRPSSGEWYVLQSREGLLVKQFGLPTDLPAPADYDGDAKTDIAVYRPSEGRWYQFNTAVGITTTVFGLSGDKPAANAFVY